MSLLSEWAGGSQGTSAWRLESSGLTTQQRVETSATAIAVVVAVAAVVIAVYSRVRLCDPMHCGPPGSSVHGPLQSVLEWVAIPFSRGSPTQGSNPGLLHCRQILYHLSHQGKTWFQQGEIVNLPWYYFNTFPNPQSLVIFPRSLVNTIPI